MKLVTAKAPPALAPSQAARLAGIAPRQLEKLLSGGWLPSLSISDVAALCTAPTLVAEGGERRPVLRHAVRRGADDQGIDNTMSLRQIADRSLGWWITDPDRWLGEAVPVTIAGRCVAALVVTGIAERTHTPPIRWRFEGYCAGIQTDLTKTESRVITGDIDLALIDGVQMMLGARAPGSSGGPVAYLAGTEQAWE